MKKYLFLLSVFLLGILTPNPAAANLSEPLPWNTNGDTLYFNNSQPTKAPIGATGYNYKSNGSLPIYDRPYNDPRRFFHLHEDWVSQGSAGATGWGAFPAGTGATTVLDTTGATGNHPGVLQFQTGTTSAGRIAISLAAPNTPNMSLGGGYTRLEAEFYLSFLSSAVDEYQFRFGFGDSTGADFTNGVYFEYDRTQSTNWRCRTASGGTRSTVTSSTAVVAGVSQWIDAYFEINSAGNSIDYYINQVKICTITTNIPTGVSHLVTPLLHIFKTAGTSQDNFSLDFVDLFMEFATAR